MNILAFMNAYSQGSSGGDVLFVRLMKELKNEHLTVVTSENGKQFCQRYGLDATFIITTKEKKFEHVLNIYLIRIIRALTTAYPDNIDLVYSSSDALPDTLPSCLLSFRRNIPWLARTYHIVPPNRMLSRLTQEISLTLIKWQSTSVVTASFLMQNVLKNRGVFPDKIRINYPGIDKKKFKNQSSSSYDAVWMGRIHPSKGVLDLVKIWSIVTIKYPKAKLAIIGTGEEQYINQLKKLIKEYKLKNSINMKGFLKDEDAFSIIASSRVFLQTSREEGFGLVIGEALSCGVPVVAYDLPVYKDVYQDVITTVGKGDMTSFAEKTMTLLKNKSDYTQIQQKGIEYITQFSWEKSARREKDILYETQKSHL